MSSPFQDKPPESAGEFFRGLWAQGKAAAAEKERVVEAVRANATDKSRGDLRMLFEEELDRHRVSRDPIWVEGKLDELEASPVDQARARLGGIAVAATALPKIIGGLGGAGHTEPPRWMQKPKDADYWAWAPGPVKVRVEINADATAVLRRVLSEAPQRVGSRLAIFDVWFDRGLPTGPIEVFVGQERLGVVEPDPPHGLATQVAAAERAGRKAFAGASLVPARHLAPPFLLVVEVAPAGAPPRPTGRFDEGTAT